MLLKNLPAFLRKLYWRVYYVKGMTWSGPVQVMARQYALCFPPPADPCRVPWPGIGGEADYGVKLQGDDGREIIRKIRIKCLTLDAINLK